MLPFQTFDFSANVATEFLIRKSETLSVGVSSKNSLLPRGQRLSRFLKTKKTPLPASSRHQLPSHRAELLGLPWAPPGHRKDGPGWASKRQALTRTSCPPLAGSQTPSRSEPRPCVEADYVSDAPARDTGPCHSPATTTQQGSAKTTQIQSCSQEGSTHDSSYRMSGTLEKAATGCKCQATALLHFLRRNSRRA